MDNEKSPLYRDRDEYLKGIQDIVTKLISDLYDMCELETMWEVSEEDEHLYTDKGLEVPEHVRGLKEDFNIVNLPIFIHNYRVSRDKSREDRYYKALEIDIKNKLAAKQEANHD